MEVYVSVCTNKSFCDLATVYRDFSNHNIQVRSIHQPRNCDYSTIERTYVTYQITLHRSLGWGVTRSWRTSHTTQLPDGWFFEHGPDVFIHSYERPIDDSLVHVLCDAFGTVRNIEYKHAPDIRHYHAKITMSCAMMACALVQIQNGFLHHDRCIFVNFNPFPFT